MSINIHKIGTFYPSESGTVLFDNIYLNFSKITDDNNLPGKIGNITFYSSALKMVIENFSKEDFITLVVSAKELDSNLLYARLLFQDINDSYFSPEYIYTVQRADIGKELTIEKIPSKILNLALLASGPLQQVISLKKNIIDQVERFERIHNELLTIYDSSQKQTKDEKDKSLEKIARNIAKYIMTCDFKLAFSNIYKMQKTLKNMSTENLMLSGILPYYFTLAFCLAEFESPFNTQDILPHLSNT